MDRQQREQGEQFVLINAVDANARGINDGTKIRVFNDRGSFEGNARVTDDVNEGVVVATLGYWRQLNKGTVNITSSAELCDMGNAPTFFDNLVQVESV
jgi:anaerobic selenocysteine-containing dehydrogenase